jgi:hypothetical protein
MARIRDIAQICKSKCRPFSVTIDVLFEDHALYHKVKATGGSTRPCLPPLRWPSPTCCYALHCGGLQDYMPRPISAGDFGDTDVYGAQQHAPLSVDIP